VEFVNQEIRRYDESLTARSGYQKNSAFATCECRQYVDLYGLGADKSATLEQELQGFLEAAFL